MKDQPNGSVSSDKAPIVNENIRGSGFSSSTDGSSGFVSGLLADELALRFAIIGNMGASFAVNVYENFNWDSS